MNLHLLEKLDYNIYYDTDRMNFICDLLEGLEENEIDLLNSSIQKQLEGLANFVLYGKDEEKDKNSLEQKKVYIKPKNTTFQRKEPQSLDALQDTLAFNESEVRPYNQRNIYTKPKQKIDRIKDSDIPTIDTLWETIDQMQRIYDISTGKEEPTEEELENNKLLTGLRLYKWRHWLIDVRRHQFYLKESAKKPIYFQNTLKPIPQHIDWENDSFYYNSDGLKHLIREHTLDLTNPNHIYHILELYTALMQECYEDLDAPGRYILFSLHDIIDETDLTPDRFDILLWKVERKSNRQICQLLKDKHGKEYAENYISTIWKQEICTKIAKQAKLEKLKIDYRHNKNMWKTCSTCGERKLLCEFVRKAGTKDSYSSRCKMCDKEKRKQKVLQ